MLLCLVQGHYRHFSDVEQKIGFCGKGASCIAGMISEKSASVETVDVNNLVS